MDNYIKHTLNPDNIKIDDRELLDFIILIKEYSKKVFFYNNKNKVDGSWYDLLKTDETFLIAEISKFEIFKFSSHRVTLIKKYDEAFSLDDKKFIFNEFFNSTFTLFQRINNWYIESLQNNLTKESSLIELELENVIQDKLSILLKEFLILKEDFFEKNLVENNLDSEIDSFNPIWKIHKTDKKNKNSDSFDENDLNYAFKKITLVFNPLYEIIYNLVFKSKDIFSESLYKNDNHKAHVGLLFTFLELMKNSFEDLNKLTKKHLDLYFKKILKLKYLPATPNKIFISLKIDENINSLTINEHTKLRVGQDENGEDILYQTDEEIQLNNIELSHISTFFISENNTYDHLSSFNLVSGLYTKTHAANQEEVDTFNNEKTEFSTLGEEQMFLSNEEMNMEIANIGFLIMSPVLTLSKSNRTIYVDFKFSIDSIKTLSDLIIDISQNKDSSEENIFYEIFSNAFVIEYTSEDAWVNIENYSVISPTDWSTGIIRVSFNLDKTYPGISSFDSSIHDLQLETHLPVLKFKLNQESFYNPYSFLNSMELLKIDLNVKVENLKNFDCYVNNEEVDINSEFELFGATPKKGDNLIIKSDELFNKKIKGLSVDWKYKNLANLNNSLKEFYEEYELGIENDSFKIQITALSNFEYSIPNKDLVFNLFDETEDGKLNSSKSIPNIDTKFLEIKPNYRLKFNEIDNFSNDLETGCLKIELIDPPFGFGSEMFDKVFNKITQKSLNLKPKKGVTDMLQFPNEPFSPIVSDISINYEAHSSLIFNEKLFSENDFDQENTFYLMSPFGLEKTFSKSIVSKNTLVESFNYEGELILGFDSFQAPCQFNLLFEILKSENQNYEFSRQIDWYYSSSDGWRLFKNSDILYDQTINLMKTGVLSLKIPSDISDSRHLFNEKKVYIKACSKNKTNQFSLIRSIRTNSISASEIIKNSLNYESKFIHPFSVEGFLEPIDGVIATDQYLSSIKGKDKESDMEFYVRSSELLRHKNRPVTKWDFEKFILAKFNWLSHVKCYSVNKEESQANINLLCLKKIEEHQNIDNIKLSSAEKKEIKDYLRSFTSPFSKIEIINPVFEDLWIKCKVSFQNISDGKGIQKLHVDFFNFICSWLYNSSNENKIGVKIKKLDIINFLNSRPYVSFITGISIIHIKKLDDGSQIAFDSAKNNIKNDYLEPGAPWSIFIPRYNHKIDLLDKNEYFAPEPINFNELGIQESFLITSDIETQSQKDKTTKNPLLKDSKFNFKLKI